ncbi:MAG TPA: redoxin domain-containing protein [Gemmata sp.]|jgi:thiol-disulfide isomerase/thioredoxin|nr:redoxin domain-containing protein [Gemmata sp.]
MHKLFLTTAFIIGLFPLASAGKLPVKPDNKEPDKKSKPLGIGDQAPSLIVTKWLQGGQSNELAPGIIYVVDFWATWCDPCIAAMPRLSILQKEYRDKGVTFIGFATKDEKGCNQERVNAFVAKRGPKLGFSFAFANDRATYETWITSGKRSIPCAFVIGKDRIIAYVGHPMFLDEVLPKVVAGTWTKTDVENMEKIEAELMAVFNALGGPNAASGLTSLGEFQKKHPLLAGIPYLVGPRISLLLKTKRVDEARKAAEEVIAKAIEADDPIVLSKVSAILRSPDADNKRELLMLSFKAAEAWLKIAGDTDMFALWNLAESYFALGDTEKAKEFGAKAIEAGSGESDAVKRYIQQRIKKFDEVKKDK